MLIKRISEENEFLAGDLSLLQEILHPKNDKIKLKYSIAIARVKPKNKTLWHKLKASEVYYILNGQGKIYLKNEEAIVRESDLIFIPPNTPQRIENIGKKDLVFMCIVEPPWNKNLEEILEDDKNECVG